mmetsp:Transcript_28468/g.89979  ORF Transcript_28468/g.89979 Transcript_28468/m.89979 type:complete len:107 (-) Transcript_28468:1030-1350(-)
MPPPGMAWSIVQEAPAVDGVAVDAPGHEVSSPQVPRGGVDHALVKLLVDSNGFANLSNFASEPLMSSSLPPRTRGAGRGLEAGLRAHGLAEWPALPARRSPGRHLP